MKWRRHHAFVFDLDGTLLDSQRYHTQAFVQAMREVCGYEPTAAEQAEYFETTSAVFSRVLAERHGLHLEPEDIVRRKRSIVKQTFRHESFAGAREFVEHWQGRKTLALASNSVSGFVHHALQGLGLDGSFDAVVCADHVSRRKPDPEIFEATLAELELAACDVLVFEDSMAGVEAARSAGCRVIRLKHYPLRQALPPDVPETTWADLLAESD